MSPDLDDTVARPPRARHRVVELGPDLDDTVTVQRPVTAPIPMAPAAVAVPTPVPVPVAVPVSVGPADPPQLVEPHRNVTTTEGSDISELAGNVWSQPLPEKPRPFRISLDDGTIVPLDQPVYLGRRPSVPRIHPGGVPLLVTLSSPLREVSSTHLVLTTVGGAVVASDVKSTNGSIVRAPGAAPHTLLGGESVVVTPGTIIELGDGNSIEVLGQDDSTPG
ncbi:MAG: hypothetical protein HIU88_06095 [Acidobacteria bacterium]|nr:hypothetical protein [Acidobacteriota bacterium]